MKFASSFLSAALASVIPIYSTPGVTTVSDVESDIATIISRTRALQKALSSFPDTGGSLTMALSIHLDVVNLRASLDKGSARVKRVQPLPVSLEDAERILEAIKFVKPIIISALEQIILKKTAFESVASGVATSIIKRDLDGLNAGISDMGSAIIAFSPPELVKVGNEIKAEIDAAMELALKAYN
ncbi:hypothetical protein JR316_0008645 [Psilocybe cubensis]|uniref:Uncharacterized protein n=2 Tax=Psilocybe cubensis TaxID=181762 RepID=A0ACB8GRZ0_PSICU|nr:hypothetical protein JR316_0008645 [Psilocybe cubensis]KAH9478192.1 hypothetical protein JR316_0008645 [Psilocybe cubensis]